MLKAWIHVTLFGLGVVVGSAAAQESGQAPKSFPPRGPSASRPRVMERFGATRFSAAARAEQSPTAGQPAPAASAGGSAASAGGPTAAPGGPPAFLPGPVPVVSTADRTKHKRQVFRLKAIPASDAAKTLEHFFRAEGKAVVPGASIRQVAIVPEMIGNSLIVSGPPDAVEEVGQLLEKLDQSAAMVRIEVIIAEVPAAAGSPPAGKPPAAPDQKPATGSAAKKAHGAGQLRVVEKPEQMEPLVSAQLTTLANNPAYCQMGKREPRITGSHMMPTGRVSSVTMESTGTIVAFTPRVGPDRVVTLEIDVEDSRLGPEAEGVVIAESKEGSPVRSPATETLTAQSTLRIADGQTVALAGQARQAKSGKERIILVTPHVLPIGGR